MGTVHHLDVAPAGPELAAAVDAFLAAMPNANTARSYSVALRALVAELGADTPVGGAGRGGDCGPDRRLVAGKELVTRGEVTGE